MAAEMTIIEGEQDRKNFARGCALAGLKAFSRSRRGLNLIVRGAGAVFITSVSVYAMWLWGVSKSDGLSTGNAQLITSLCAAYLLAAILLVVSLKWLRVYAGIGIILAAFSWSYLMLTGSELANISPDFLLAICFEATGFMAGLLAAVTYLNWLYDPSAEVERAK